MIEVGKKAPTFTLPSSDGHDVSLAALAGTYVVVYFYPRDDTPGCTIEANEFTAALPRLTELGAVVLGVSRDSYASHCKFRDKYGIGFPLLTDKDAKVMEAYGAWGEKTLYGKKTTGVIRSTVLVAPDGKVARHWKSVKAKGHADAVVAAIAEARGGAPAAAPATTPAKKAPAASVTKPPVKKASAATASKTAAKKTPAKKTPAKKTPAKKAAQK